MQRPRQITTGACLANYHLSQRSLLSILSSEDPVGYTLQDGENTTSVQFNEKKHFLETLDLDDWIITSFNPLTREVCVKITTMSGNRIISLTLPITY